MPPKTMRTICQQRTPMAAQDPKQRIDNFSEVTLGYSLADARNEAERCLMCPQEPCVKGCPVGIDIPGFIQKICDQDYRGAYEVLADATLLPAICGRVCPQEDQCEGACVVTQKLESVGIGRLERFIGDMAIAEGWSSKPDIEPNGYRSTPSLKKCSSWESKSRPTPWSGVYFPSPSCAMSWGSTRYSSAPAPDTRASWVSRARL
jgi:glutamate synthase (NADPH/NADH) small chain